MRSSCGTDRRPAILPDRRHPAPATRPDSTARLRSLLKLACATACLLAGTACLAKAMDTAASQALLVDGETGAVLFAKAPDEPFPPAALAKLMTMEVVFHGLGNGTLSLDRTFVISENAWRTGGAPSGGSTMFAKVKSEIALADLVQGAIVQSANDACIAIAEGMAGSEAEFARQMTERARDIGLERSQFRNATGLPAEGQVVTARELVDLARHIWQTYPHLYRYYAQPEFTWNKITQRNRNPLLSMDIGADGLGTGYTEASGYAIVGSASRNGTRLFLAMSGLASERERAAETRRMLDWGMQAFRRASLFDEGEVVGKVDVFGGERAAVELVAHAPVAVFVPGDHAAAVTARIVYDGPLAAPLEKGAEIGRLQVLIGDVVSVEAPLFAREAVGLGSIHRRAFDALLELMTGWTRRPSAA